MSAFDARWACLAAIALSAACAAPSSNRRAESPLEGPALVVREARLAVARGETLDGRRVPSDCSGFVRALFLSSGIDLFSSGREGESGVRAIARYVARHGTWTKGPLPQLGDLAFFDNSYDRNGDGRLDDRLTHIGVVAALDDDGTALIAHATNHGIVLEPMNLLRRHDALDASGKPINGALRRRSSRDSRGTPHLMGELFAAFGRVLR